MATLALAPPHGATTFTWLTINRLALAHRDGSLTTWSVLPTRLLSRHPATTSHITTLASAFPSSPYVVSITPGGGHHTLLDLSSPSNEASSQHLQTVNFHPNSTCWSDHLQCFIGVWPSVNPVSEPSLVSANIRAFPAFRRGMTLLGAGRVCCVAVGKRHLFQCAGTLGGEVWVSNPARIMFEARGGVAGRKMRVFTHEYRPVERWCAGREGEGEGEGKEEGKGVRGAVRFLQGWKSELNRDPKKMSKMKRVGDEAEGISDMSAAVVHEPGTRVEDAKWNPNGGYGCWLAAAMGSGVVRVMDLGIGDE